RMKASVDTRARKPVTVTPPADTDQPPFPGRARQPGDAGAGFRVAGYREAHQKPASLSRKIGPKKQRLTEPEQQQIPPERPPSTLGVQRSIYFSSPEGHPTRLGPEFFDQPAVTLARAFLGQVLVRRLTDGTELRGRIVETEAYLGPEDEAAHSRGGRQTPRNRGMFMKPGTLYVYIIYGMYFCLNVSSQGDGACVLLRALEPMEGLETMRQLRSTLRKSSVGRALKDRELCNGPSKLCQALAIDKSFDQRDLTQDEAVWLECGSHTGLGPSELAVVTAARVGIGYAGEWTQKPLRFYIQGSPWVSVTDRVAEQTACSDKL
uniref:DNA-3-methyladenine glycosylase n=1 Tax=Nannospalax galili TaxID=1026970 RepID=A0A8C6WBG4_NANGA